MALLLPLPAGLRIAALAVALAAAMTTPAAAQQRVLDHDAYEIWKTIRGETLSTDGAWVLYHLAPRVGDSQLVVTSRTGREHRVDRVANARFAPTSTHVVFTIRPAHDSVRALRIAETKKDDMPEDTLGILAIPGGEVVRVPGVRSWKLPADGGSVVAYLLGKPRAAEAEPDPEAQLLPEPEPEPIPEPEPEPEPAVEEDTDDDTEERKKPDSFPLILRSLETGEEHRFDDVVWYGLSEDGGRLVYTASNEDGTADGVYLVETSTGAARALLTGEGAYEQVTVSKDGRQVAFLTDRDDYEADQPGFSLYHWRDGGDTARRLAGSGSNGIPGGWWISQEGELEFSDSGSRLFFGTAPRPAPESEDSLPADEKVRIDIWHWQDPYIQPMQLLQAEDEAKRTYRAVVHLNDRNRVVQLASEALPEVEVGSEGDARWALAETGIPYRHLVGTETPNLADLWLVDVRTGERQQVRREVQAIGAHLSPGARYVAWYDAGARHWLARPTGGRSTDTLTAAIPFPVWDEMDDHPMPPYPYGIAGWTEGDAELLVYDRYDIWAVDPAGRSAPRRITEGYGRENQLRLRYVDLDREEPAIARTAPLLLSAFHLDDKRAGFFRDRVTGSTLPERLVLEPKSFGRPTRAEQADVLLFTREDVAEFPDLWVADGTFDDPVKLSDANPQQSRYNWATVELVEWLSADGVPLQGLLYRPEDFDPARRYPMLVNFYERDSDNLHQHHPPLPHRSVIRPTFYASRGYVVFVPDIAYEEGYPGESALDAVMPGTLRLAAEPWIDETNVGVQGHSWGGYQIAYMITQTDFFKAAAAGAPVANMTSAYGGIRWGTGVSRVFQYERTQSRIGGSLWDETARYIENSPLFFLDRVKTPLLIMHNDEDGAVPWYQGIELFIGLRRLAKPAWMVVYNEEPHWPTTPAHIRDWNIRMQQFFDHFLKGTPAPQWLVEGVPATEKGRSLGLDPVEAPRDDGGAPGHH